LRFYLKYIEPNRAQIEKGKFNDLAISMLPGFEAIMGLQFENLVLSNGNLIIQKLNIKLEDVVNDGTYDQIPQQSTGRKGCQIDYMIQHKSNILYACEVKFSVNEVGISVVSEMQEKLNKLSKPRGFAAIPVLIHVNGVSNSVINSDYFRVVDFGEMMK